MSQSEDTGLNTKPWPILVDHYTDRRITERLINALSTIDVPVLDHIVVGDQCVSFAERGWLEGRHHD